MKRFFFISITAALIGAGTYYLWKINNKPPTLAWDLVPEDALAVYEHNSTSAATTTWILKSFLPDSAIEQMGEMKELLISVHRVGKGNSGVLLFMPAASGSKLFSVKGAKLIKKRMFEGKEIMEIELGHRPYSATSIDGIRVISATSLLIEDVIRLVKAEEKISFSLSHSSLFQFPKVEWDGGRTYVNISRMPFLFELFLQETSPGPMRLANSALVDVKNQNNGLVLSGFALDSIPQQPAVLTLFNNQRPVAVTLQKISSARAGWLVHFGISDYVQWHKDRIEVCGKRFNARDSLATLKDRFGFDASVFYATLGNELGICRGGIFTDDVLICKVADPNIRNELEKLDIKAGPEVYSQYEIHTLTINNFCTSLFWPLSTQTVKYYAVVDGYLIFAQQTEDLKAFLDDIDADNTWGKSSEWNKFLLTTPETNAGVIFDGLNAWPSVKEMIYPKWNDAGDSVRLFNIARGSIELSRLEKKYYLNGALQFETVKKENALPNKEKYIDVMLPRPLSSSLEVVKNHNNGSSELLAQDDENNLLLLSSQLKQLFKIPLDGRIQTEISQIDIYKNKKLQYLFATEKNIWLIDRLGNTVKGFPIALSGRPIRSLAALDPENNKNYQFLVTDDKGTITKYDSKGRIPNGWQPIEVRDDLWVPPRMARSTGKDYIVVVTKSGKIHCFTDQGRLVTGFPAQLKETPSGTWALEKSGDGMVMNFVSGEGMQMQVDFGGKVNNKAHLVKSSAASRFALVRAVGTDRTVISRIDRGKLSVLDPIGEVIFERENGGSDDMFLTFFDFERGRKIFAFSDPQQGFTYFYDQKGTPVFSKPLENEQRPAIIPEKAGNFYFYGVTKDKIQSYRRERMP